MRYKAAEMTDRKEIEEILNKAPIGRIGLASNNQPYVVPVHFTYDDGKIFLHSGNVGMKIDYLNKNPKVCFETDEFQSLVFSPNPCNFETKYKSIIAFGTAKILTDKEQKFQALKKLISKYGGKEESLTLEIAEKFISSLDTKVEVIEIKISDITGKKT